MHGHILSIQTHTIGIVGAGPMALYTLKELINSRRSLHITVFESANQAGSGMPYSSDMNADFMYCNAFSHEIPTMTQPLTCWLESQDRAFLQDWNLTPDLISSRAFYPRVLLGKYMESEFADICDLGWQNGHQIKVLTGHQVLDISPDPSGGAECLVQTHSGTQRLSFNKVIIATGHDWPTVPRIDEVDLVSPWPYTNIQALKAGPIGVLGSSLSAIDTVIALGFEHGEFHEEDNCVSWFAKDSSSNLNISMVSHKGIMPEPDFYYPYPYLPLKHVNPEAVCQEVSKGSDQLLKRVFDLLIAELTDADPEYMIELGAGAETVSGFAKAYFERRERLGGLKALRETLEESQTSKELKQPIAYRYSLLRGHESFELILEHLNQADWKLFMDQLMPVFADCYSAVPHVSVRRILALYDAGVLEILPTGASSQFSGSSDAVTVSTLDGKVTLDAMIDARGQSSASMRHLPFKSLTGLLKYPDRPILQPFEVQTTQLKHSGIYCLAMPQLLERHPFSQGLPNCKALAVQVVESLDWEC